MSVLPISETLISEDIRKQGYKLNKNPYITILPSVKSEESFELPEFESPHNVEVSGMGVDPSMENPKQVYLDVSDDMIIQLWRDELIRQVPEDKIVGDKDKMKVVLLEREDNGAIDPQVRDRLVDSVYDFNPPSTVTTVDLTEKAPEYLHKT